MAGTSRREGGGGLQHYSFQKIPLLAAPIIAEILHLVLNLWLSGLGEIV